MSSKKVNNLMFYIIFFLVIFFITKSCLLTDYDNKNIEAYAFSQQIVEQKLKAPSTASFPTLNNTMIYKNNNTYVIKSYVDSQNSFGVTVRNNYECTLEENNNTFTLLDFKFSN